MSRTKLAVVVLLAGLGLAGAEEPPYKRQLQGDDVRKAEELHKQVEELWGAGKFAEAVAAAEELLALRQRVQGEGHWEAAKAARVVRTLGRAAALPAGKQASLAQAPGLAAQAVALRDRGKFADAEPLLRKVLEIYEGVLGPKNSGTTESCNNLADNLHVQGRFKDAEALYRKALAVDEEVLGTNDPATAAAEDNLGDNLNAQGRYKEAEPLLRHALSVREGVLGPRYPETARSYNNLAGNYQDQGRFWDAEPLFRKALAVKEEVLGLRDPATAFGYVNLAVNLDSQGRAQEAEPLFRKALAINTKVLGLGHPDTATSCNNLAGNLHAQGRYREAEPLYRQALAVYEEALGARHAYTARCRHNLAFILTYQGRFREAEALLRKALTVCEEANGLQHPETAFIGNSLARNLDYQKRYPEAEALYRKALAVREKLLGAQHPDTRATYVSLAFNLQDQGRSPEAESYFRKAVAAVEEVRGPRHRDTAWVYHHLAHFLNSQRRFKEAETLSRKATVVFEEALGSRHPYTAASYATMATSLHAQGRLEDAEPYWKAAADAIEAARLRMAASALDRAAVVRIHPHPGLALCRARLGRPLDAWTDAEAGLARGLLDDLAALPADPEGERQARDRAARLDALDRVLAPLLAAEKLDDRDRRLRDKLLEERATLDDEAARAGAAQAVRAVLPLESIQFRMLPDSALIFWIDFAASGDHWGCVVRSTGLPAWVRLRGTGPEDAWTDADDRLCRLVRDDLARGEPDALAHARGLAVQRLDPLAPHLAASAALPAVRHLIVVPVGVMAGVPVEVLTDRYLISYAPSGSVFARLRGKHRPLADPTLLALGDPNFALPDAGPPPEPPDHGLYLSLVLPGGNAARAGLRAGDVLLRYGDVKLTTKADLKVAESGERVAVRVWRDGKIHDDLGLAPGKLGVVLGDDPPAAALRKRRDRDRLADVRSRAGVQALPGTRLEVAAIAALFPREKTTLLLGSKASEQELDALVGAGKWKDYRLVHLATHGNIDPVSAASSSLLLARDRLPDLAEQDRLRAAGRKVPTGRLWVDTIAHEWQDLDADLVTLSACETALGPDAGGSGLLGFTQVLLGRGARSVVLSLWKVDDTATALLMRRFYQNLLGKRDGLDKPLPKAEALREAKDWLRDLRRSELEELAGKLAEGVVRAKEEPLAQNPPRKAARPALPAGDRPFAHPRYWAPFILIGDPE